MRYVLYGGHAVCLLSILLRGALSFFRREPPTRGKLR